MIEVVLDHSYQDDYFRIDTVTVKINDISEKERIEKLVKKYNMEGSLVDIWRLREEIAEALEVDIRLIDIDTNEIDLM